MNGSHRRKDIPARFVVAVSWLAAFGWTLLLGYFMLWPSDGTTVEDVSKTFGGSDLTDAAGHVALFLVETAALYNLLRHYLPAPRALYGAIGGTLVLGLMFEAAQTWIPARGFALLDLGANWSGVGLFAAWQRRRLQVPGRE